VQTYSLCKDEASHRSPFSLPFLSVLPGGCVATGHSLFLLEVQFAPTCCKTQSGSVTVYLSLEIEYSPDVEFRPVRGGIVFGQHARSLELAVIVQALRLVRSGDLHCFPLSLTLSIFPFAGMLPLLKPLCSFFHALAV